MDILTKLDELERYLQAAQEAETAAFERWSSCTINTPGRCQREQRELDAARELCRRIEAKIRRLQRTGR